MSLYDKAYFFIKSHPSLASFFNKFFGCHFYTYIIGEKGKEFSLSDRQVIDSALQVISPYVNSHKGFNINSSACVQLVMEEVKKIYTEYTGIQEDSDEYLKLIERIRDELIERTTRRMHRLIKSRKVTEINSVTGQALIETSLKKRAKTYALEMKKYGAKVHIKLAGDRIIFFTVKYDEIQSGKLEEILDNVEKLTNQLAEKDREVLICKSGYMKWLT